VKTTVNCDGNFTGDFLILVHGNYNEKYNYGHLYLEEPSENYIKATKRVVDFVKSERYDGEKKVYIFACGQGRPSILEWYKSSVGFNTQYVRCPCTTAMMAGAIDTNDILSFFGIPTIA
jgi:hypothetical protein